MILVLMVVGCAAQSIDSDYIRGLRASPPAQVAGEPDALAVIAAVYGIDSSQPEIHWVEGDRMADPAGAPVTGITFECESWVLWWHPGSLSGDPNGDRALSPTALAHEVAHCANYLLHGDIDAGHTNARWWGDGGFVDQARDRLLAAGL